MIFRILAAFFDPPPVTRDRLGKLGGNPHFIPPPRDIVNDLQHGIPPGSEWTKDDPAVSSRKC
jgi:hypothetical protein